MDTETKKGWKVHPIIALIGRAIGMYLLFGETTKDDNNLIDFIERQAKLYKGDKPITVYISGHGESGEGYTVQGIFTTKEAAIKNALSHEAYFGDKQWNPAKYADDTWINGCDYVCVRDFVLS